MILTAHFISFFAVILIFLQLCCQGIKAADVLEIYIDATECGDGRYMDFHATFTPYPLIFVDKLDFWVGGRVSLTKAAQQLAQNITFEDFSQNLLTSFIFVNASFQVPNFFFELAKKYNNSQSSGHLLDDTLVPNIYEAMREGKQNVSFFLGSSLNEGNAGNIVEQRIMAWIDQELTELSPLYFQIRLKQLYEGSEISCWQLEFKTNKYNNVTYDPNTLNLENYNRAFQTPKYKSRNGTMECPENSMPFSNATIGKQSLCQCDFPRSGPFCQFQCTQEQMAICNESQPICSFDVSDYAHDCIVKYSIPVSNGSITVIAPDLHSLNVSWQATNFTSSYHFLIGMMSATENERRILHKMTYYIEGIPTSIRIDQASLQLYGNIATLDMSPFTNYLLTLSYDTDTNGIWVGSVTFTTPEISPTQVPQITVAHLEKNKVNIDWILPGQCPGLIRTYDISILCDSLPTDSHPQLGNQGNISFDCRDHVNASQLFATVPLTCQSGRNLKVQLRVGTCVGMSDWSKPFDIPNTSWPLIVIIAVAFGAFILAVLLGAVGFYYYYKQHVQNYEGVYNTLKNLMHRSRTNGIGQSFRTVKPLANAPSKDLFTIDAEDFGSTKFEPTPQPQSPCSAVPSPTQISALYSIPRVDNNSPHYNAATFFE